jgi:hypothetical protein
MKWNSNLASHYNINHSIMSQLSCMIKWVVICVFVSSLLLLLFYGFVVELCKLIHDLGSEIAASKEKKKAQIVKNTFHRTLVTENLNIFFFPFTHTKSNQIFSRFLFSSFHGCFVDVNRWMFCQRPQEVNELVFGFTSSFIRPNESMMVMVEPVWIYKNTIYFFFSLSCSQHVCLN